MNKKKIISTTILFLVIVISVVLFKSVFGAKNTLVGVAGITAALSLLGTDYTLNPIKNIFYFIFLEVGLGVAAFLASTNAFLGLFITFIVVFFILYSFTYNTKKPTYVAFTLGYFFMLYTPVTLQELPSRLSGLAFCGLAIMILQLLANRNKLQKQTIIQLKSSLHNITKEIELINSSDIDNQNFSSLNTVSHNNLKSLIESLYEVIDKDIKLPMTLFQYLFIGLFLDSLNITLAKLYKTTKSSPNLNLDNLLDLLTNLETFIDGHGNINVLLSKIDVFLSSTNFPDSKNYLNFELYSYASILKRDLYNTQSSSVSEISDQYFVKNLVSSLDSLKNNIRKDSLKFTFAFRGALVTSLGVFIVSLFDITYGKWLVFSLMSIVQPFLDSSKVKGKQRIFGTIIGFLIFEIVFSIVTDTMTRTLIILLVGYLSNYQTNYRNQMVCTTISALGAASIGSNITLLGVERLLFVLIGTLIALYANKFILPYEVSVYIKYDLKISLRLNEKIISTLYKKSMGSVKFSDDLKSIININKLLNKKIHVNNEMLLSPHIDDYIYTQHVFMNEIRVLSNMFKDYERSNSDKLKLLYHIDYLTNKELSENRILQYIDSVDDILSQLILINLLKVKSILSDSKKIYDLVID